MQGQEESIEKAVSVLSSAVSKCSDLLTKLQKLEELNNKYANCKEEEKDNYKNQINSLEKEIDEVINSINSLSVDIDDSTVAFEGYMADLRETYSLEKLKAEFIGDVNDRSRYYIDPAYAYKAKDLVMFDNTTGEIINKGDTIYLKPGETRVLTVRLPDYAGEINQLIRASADGDGSFRSKQVITARSDVNPDPNVITGVNYKSGNIPNNVDLHTNYYEWVITATGSGHAKASQTCEYTTFGNGTPKCMTLINVVVS